MIGLKELVLLAVVALALYGRSGVFKSRRFQQVRPWLSPVRRTPPGRPSPPAKRWLEGNRLFWFLTILAATAMVSLIVTRALILSR